MFQGHFQYSPFNFSIDQILFLINRRHFIIYYG